MREKTGRLSPLVIIPFILAAIAIFITAGSKLAVTPSQQVPGGDPARGQAMLVPYGCGSCHVIPGVPGANGRVGPALVGIGDRSMIAGRLPNTPANLEHWIVDPQGVDPGNDMPNMGVSDQSAADIAAYLYTLH